MERFNLLSLIVAIVIIACNRNTVGSKEPVIPKRDATITGIPAKQPVTQLSSTIAGNQYYISQGKNIYETKCTRCHMLKNTADFTERRWDGILDVMASRARLSTRETEQVATYIKANAKK